MTGKRCFHCKENSPMTDESLLCADCYDPDVQEAHLTFQSAQDFIEWLNETREGRTANIIEAA